MPDFDAGLPGCLRIVGQDAGHELQVALIRAPGRERLGQLQRDVLSGGRAADVDDRRLGGHLDLLGHPANLQGDWHCRRLRPSGRARSRFARSAGTRRARVVTL